MAPLPDPAGPRDEVDRIVLAWQRERPDLDVQPLAVLSRVSRLARHLDLARRSAFERHHLDHRLAGLGDDKSLTLRCLVDQARKVGFGIVDVDGEHD